MTESHMEEEKIGSVVMAFYNQARYDVRGKGCGSM